MNKAGAAVLLRLWAGVHLIRLQSRFPKFEKFSFVLPFKLKCIRLLSDSQLAPVTGWNLMDEKTEESVATKKNLSACNVEALRKCLEENNGDRVKCQSQIQAFESSCSVKKPNPSLQSGRGLKTGV